MFHAVCNHCILVTRDKGRLSVMIAGITALFTGHQGQQMIYLC